MWKERVNTVLAKSIGYQLQRAGTPAPVTVAPGAPAPRAPMSGGAKDAKQATAKASTGAKTAGTKAAARAAGKKPMTLPMHYDEDAKRIITQVFPRTMTGREKLFGLIIAVRHLAQHEIPGDIVECGVWRGGSMQAAALALTEAGDTSRHLHLFDTFEGMPPPTEEDRLNDGTPASALLETSEKDSHLWAVAGLDDVQEGMAELDYPQDQIHFHQGMVEETIPSQAPAQIALLRLDTDWYASTKHELEHLYDRLSPGGILIIDDYGHWEGSRLATQEFMARSGGRLLLLPLGTGRIGIKPPV